MLDHASGNSIEQLVQPDEAGPAHAPMRLLDLGAQVDGVDQTGAQQVDDLLAHVFRDVVLRLEHWASPWRLSHATMHRVAQKLRPFARRLVTGFMASFNVRQQSDGGARRRAIRPQLIGLVDQAGSPTARQKAAQLDDAQPADRKVRHSQRRRRRTRPIPVRRHTIGQGTRVDIPAHLASRSSRISTSLEISWNGHIARKSAFDGRRVSGARGSTWA